ncbi:MAG: hypothetical protein Q7W44_04165 [Coriobacteriia bacterium]|nr:hypothetical protein [Coriobacteriia bacterium]
MYIYEEAQARYAGPHVTDEIESAMVRVQEKHHDRLVNEVVGLLHEEIMGARLTSEEEVA